MGITRCVFDLKCIYTNCTYYKVNIKIFHDFNYKGNLIIIDLYPLILLLTSPFYL